MTPPELIAANTAGGRHRTPARSGDHTALMATMAVAAGALLAGTASTGVAQAHTVQADVEEVRAPEASAPGNTAVPPTAPQVLTLPALPDANAMVEQLAKGGWFADQRAVLEAQRAALEAQTRKPLAVKPVSGTLTSDFGPRWGTTHTGLDIANDIGTPIYAAADGTVIDSGPASGFGLWVRIQHDDGSMSTYGHINETLVSTGQRVNAGDQIATVGNRGQSTGPHLHFEVADPTGLKVDPKQWLEAKGVDITEFSKA